MTPELQEKLKSCPNLPSPPTIALKIIELANDPDADFKHIVQLLNCDPALASKILRTANSPLYPYGKKVENLYQATMVIGLNATMSLALSFSLVNSLQAEASQFLVGGVGGHSVSPQHEFLDELSGDFYALKMPPQLDPDFRAISIIHIVMV